jgi:hypothetical protein
MAVFPKAAGGSREDGSSLIGQRNSFSPAEKPAVDTHINAKITHKNPFFLICTLLWGAYKPIPKYLIIPFLVKGIVPICSGLGKIGRAVIRQDYGPLKYDGQQERFVK